MKRILIRMSVLTGVVVLGAIAIAQAQRGTTDSAPMADAASSAPVDEGSPAPILTSPSARSSGPEPGVNPLREKRISLNDLASAPASGGNRSFSTPSADSASPGRARAATALPATIPDPFATPADVPRGADRPRAFNTAALIGTTSPANAGVVPTAATTDKLTEASQTAAGNGTPTLASTTSVGSARPSVNPPAILAPPANSGAETSNTFSSAPAASKEPPRPIGTEPSRPGRELTPAPMSPAPTSQPARTSEPAPFKLDPSASGSSMPLMGTSTDRGAADRAPPQANPSQGGAMVPDASASFGTGKPGARQLEGPQSPSLTVHKVGPPETQVGKTATFQTKIRNIGQTAAHSVEVRDEVPKGTRLVGTTPRATPGARGELVWQLGTIKPGDEVVVQMQIMPLEEGEIGSVATVHFNAEASIRTVSTKPELAIRATGPGRAAIGDEVGLAIVVSNPGSGTAENVVLEAKIPPSLRHPAGSDLEYEVGLLKPKESRQLELKLTAVEAGVINMPLIARAEANLKADGRFDLEVVSPRLEVALEGPKRRFLEREAVYTLSVSNPGTAPARQVQLVCHLPPGLQFVNANNSGQYEATTRTVHWLLEELPVRETGKVELTTMPTEAGEHKLVLRGLAEKGVSAEKEQPVLIEGVAAIRFDLTSLANPIVRGSETGYEIRVMNQGSKAASNVRVSLLLPPEMRAIAAEGPTRHQLEPNRVVFEGLSQLAPKADTTYRVRVQGLQSGDLRIRALLQTDEIQTPVTKEESTRVYSDE